MASFCSAFRGLRKGFPFLESRESDLATFLGAMGGRGRGWFGPKRGVLVEGEGGDGVGRGVARRVSRRISRGGSFVNPPVPLLTDDFAFAKSELVLVEVHCGDGGGGGGAGAGAGGRPT